MDINCYFCPIRCADFIFMIDRRIILVTLITGILVLVHSLAPHLHLNEHFVSVTSIVGEQKYTHTHGDDCSHSDGRAEECLVKDAYVASSRSVNDADQIPEPVILDLSFGVAFLLNGIEIDGAAVFPSQTLLFNPYVKYKLSEAVLPVSGLRAPPVL